MKRIGIAILMLTVPLMVQAQTNLYGFDAESGNTSTEMAVVVTLGDDFSPPLDDPNALGGKYITSATDFRDTPGEVSTSPATPQRVITYDITFPEQGVYDLYGRFYVGPAAYDDDSCFVATSFGEKDPMVESDWVRINGLANAGTEQYFWINVTADPNNWVDTDIPLIVVTNGESEVTLQFGAREDGLRIDAFAFGNTSNTYSDAELDLAATGPGIFYPLEEVTPTGDAELNDVSFSAKVIDWTYAFQSASLYYGLDTLSNATEVAVSAETLTGTTTVSSTSSLTLDPGADYTAYLIVEGLNGDTVFVTNSWTFSMAPRFDISVSPAAVATAYDFQPTVSAQVVDLNDVVDYVELYIDGDYASLEVSGSGTTTVSYTTGTLAPGDMIEAEVIVYTLGDYGSYTNTWSIMMGGTPGVTVWNPDAPPLGGFDIAQTNGALDYTENVGPDAEQTVRHEWTYISDDNRPAQGQTFTTPSGGLAYYVDSVWLRDPTYDDGGSNLSSTGNTFTVRITNPSLTNTAQFVRSEQLLTLHNSYTEIHSGEWIQFRLAEPVVVLANQVYGFDVGSVGGYYMNTDGSNADPYAGGNAYRSGDNGDGSLMAELNTLGDRAFIVQLSEAVDAFSIEARSPTGSGVKNPAQIQVDFTELSGTFDQANTKILLDGVEQFVNPATGSSPNYTITADLLDQEPNTTHTGMVVLASSFPVTTLTNEWTFSMGDAFAFTGEEPAPGPAIQDDDPSLSVDVISVADYFFGATMHLDGGPDLGPSIVTSGDTSTVSVASTGVLNFGLHTVDVIAEGNFGFVTNSWEFRIKERTDDNIWNINIAGSNGGTVRNVTQGTIAVAPGSGSNYWNNVTGPGAQPTGHTNSVTVTDSNGENPIGFIVSGIGYYGQETGDGMTVELVQGWFGGTDAGQPPNADFSVSLTGLTSTASYDLYIYDTWRWGENNSQTFEVIEGYVFNNPAAQTSRNVNNNVANDAPQDYSNFVDGENYALITRVTPVDGVITFLGGNDADRVISGLQVRERPGDGYIPGVELISASPDGNVTNTTADIEGVLVDTMQVVETNNLVLLLDGVQQAATVEKTGSTTTVSYAASGLGLGTHTVGIVPYVDARTNEWTFFVAYETSKPTSMVHHWDFMDGGGTIVTDVAGDADGTIIGTNHLWLAGGGLDLLGGGSSSDWNETTVSGAGSYVDLPNGMISALGNATTFEVTYISEADLWARVFSFGVSNGGEDISNSGAGQFFVAAQGPVGGPRAEKANTFTFDESDELENNLSHIVVVYDVDNGFVKMYRNGEMVAFQVIPDAAPFSELNDLNNWIGRSQWPDPMFNGKIYDLAIYDGVMTAAEALARYEEITGAPAEGPPIDLAIPAGGPLMIAWPTSFGTDFSVLTNDDLLNAAGWGIADLVPYDNGEGYYVITNDIGSESSLFYILESN